MQKNSAINQYKSADKFFPRKEQELKILKQHDYFKRICFKKPMYYKEKMTHLFEINTVSRYVAVSVYVLSTIPKNNLNFKSFKLKLPEITKAINAASRKH